MSPDELAQRAPARRHPLASARIAVKARLLAVVTLLAVAACGGASEREAFEEVLATLSLEKASAFLREHPDGSYADQLIGHLLDWCRQEPSPELRRALAETLPSTHPRRADLRQRCGGTE